jgi:protein-S-isoprenylcysteine O-methyltransferase Ste14
MLGAYEFFKRGIIPALTKKEMKNIDSNQADHKLVTTGIYRFIRHPQYIGLFTFSLGYFLFFNAFFSLCISPMILVWFETVANIE